MLKDFKFHHIGYAVKDIEKTSMLYIQSGWEKTSTILDPIQNTYISFLRRKDMPLIELVAPVDEFSPISKTLKHSGVSTYHICYAVEDIDKAVADLRKEKFVALFKPVEAIALNMNKICYLYNQNIGLIELVECL